MTVTVDVLLEEAAVRAARRRVGVVIGHLGPDGTLTRGVGDTGHGTTPGADTLFEIGSITKVFTATLLADGVVRGVWRLDTPVRDLLPAGTVVPSCDGVAITLEHLATHTSGLPRSPIPVVGGTVRMLRGRDPYAGLDTGGLLAAVGSTRLRRAPGTGPVAYSNLGVGLLGHALAHASGTSYDALVADRVCGPLGLVDTVTTATTTPEQAQRLARGHRGRGRPVDPWVLEGIAGAGALRSTATDLLRFLSVQVDPTGSPLEEAVRLTHQPRRDGRRGIALAWMRVPEPHLLLWHNGGTGGFRAFAGVRPGRRDGVVVLANHARGVDLTALRLLRDLDAG